MSCTETPHTDLAARLAAGCAALDYGYATWFSHQVDEVIARDEEDDLAGDGRLPHNDHRGK